MVLTCPRCSRKNPAQALFCYNDGFALGDPTRTTNDPARQRFLAPFVFPSGQGCHTFDELALALVDRWEEARELLSQGVFAGFFAGIGRADLARAARDAGREADTNHGLDQLLRRIPAKVMKPARLAVEPAQVNLGSLRPGQAMRFDVRLSNQGMGLVQGTISCVDCPWLLVGDPSAHQKQKLFQFLHDVVIPVHVHGKGLPAGNRTLTAELLLESGGVQVKVPIQADVPVIPFGEGVLKGALSPRQVAEKAKSNPREAGELFARGAVARWYEANGWTYPVKDPAASGVAAVQQFFEALGVASAPRVSLNVSELRLVGKPGDIVRGSLEVSTQEKKPVFAHATSDQPWLQVNDVVMDGRTATINLRVVDIPDRPGTTMQAHAIITANGRQRFIIPVSLAIQSRPKMQDWYKPVEVPVVEPRAAPPPPETRRAPDPEPVRPAPPPEVPRLPQPDDAIEEPMHVQPGNRLLRALWPVLFLVVGLGLTLVSDLIGWVRNPDGGEGVAEETRDISNLPALLTIRYHTEPVKVKRRTDGILVPPTWAGIGLGAVDGEWQPSLRFGVTLLAPEPGGKMKRLTFLETGLTNNTVVRIDGRDTIFGEGSFRDRAGNEIDSSPGQWISKDAPMKPVMKDGRRSIWGYARDNVQVTQTVGLVPGAQSGKLDTCLVRYLLENKDTQAHSLGLRVMLDTFIGQNDGVPFTVPGLPGLCNTSLDLDDPRKIPDFIQAREREDLANPGTIALIQPRVPGSDAPSRVTLGVWPNWNLGDRCKAAQTLWEVPVMSIKEVDPPDSCVVIYWNERPLKPGESRTVAFAYGLGSVSADETGGALGLTAAGSFEPRGEFTLTAEVRQPSVGQTVTVTLPEGFTLVEGQSTQPVPATSGAGGISPVTWRIRAGSKTGKFSLRVQSSSGTSQSKAIQIRTRGLFGS